MLSELKSAGVTAAFIDADQLRLASGVAASETELIAYALPSLGRKFHGEGAQLLIVAGLADDDQHLAQLLPHVPRERVLAVHLGADSDTIRERIQRRGWMTELADAAVDYATQLDPGLGDLYLDTTHQTPSDLAAAITEAALLHLEHLAPEAENAKSSNQKTLSPDRVVTITGPGGVGVSTVGFQTFVQLASSGDSVGYLDAHQLGFLATTSSSHNLDALRAHNARAVVSSLTCGGAHTVVVSGDSHTMRTIERTWDVESVTMFWLDASASAIAERITCRANGTGPPLQGNHRRGLTGTDLDKSIAAAVEESEQHYLRPEKARILSTTGLEPGQAAAAIVAALPVIQ